MKSWQRNYSDQIIMQAQQDALKIAKNKALDLLKDYEMTKIEQTGGWIIGPPLSAEIDHFKQKHVEGLNPTWYVSEQNMDF